jgi:hypothetical protein
MFRGAALYGVLALVPMYFFPMPPVGPETYYGFIGCALVFQWLFWIIGSDPVKYRPLMLVAVAEKLVFAVPALILIVIGKTPPVVALFAVTDLLFGTGFLIARSRTAA